MPRRRDDWDDDDDLRPRRRRPPARRKQGSNLAIILILGGVALALILAGAGVAGYLLLRKPTGGGGAGASDLERLSGSWECTFRDPAGRVTMHKVKEIAGTTETATWYRPDGGVFRANRVEFELVTRGRDKVFRYFNGRVLVGPDAGQVFPPGEYVYTLEGDTWTEYEPTGGVIVWTRKR